MSRETASDPPAVHAQFTSAAITAIANLSMFSNRRSAEKVLAASPSARMSRTLSEVVLTGKQHHPVMRHPALRKRNLVPTVTSPSTTTTTPSCLNCSCKGQDIPILWAAIAGLELESMAWKGSLSRNRASRKRCSAARCIR